MTLTRTFALMALLIAACTVQAQEWQSHFDRPLVFSSSQLKYGLYQNYLHSYMDRPLFMDTSLRENAVVTCPSFQRIMDHAMMYDAFAHLPLYMLEDTGFVGRGESGAFIAEGNTRPGGKLPLNTSGGGLSYTHTGMYGMFAIQEAVRQLRGEAAAQVPDVEISFVQGVGMMFAAAGSLVLSNKQP